MSSPFLRFIFFVLKSLRRKEIAMSISNSQKLLEPFVLTGPAIDRDNAVKDKNDAPVAIESLWIERLNAQNEGVSSAEVAFITELRSRQK